MVLDLCNWCDPLDGGDKEGHTVSDSSASSADDDGILECDYDTQVTKLYHSIEERQWEEVLYFLETSKWYATSVWTAAFGEKVDPPGRQARTWVTALDGSGNVRWCQLPLHAAITFLAPFSIISKLVEVYPKSVRCADDQDMLPLHYAFRFGAEDDVLLYLLEKFPQAISKKAVKDRLPLDLAQFGPRPERGNIIDYYMQSAVRNAKNEWDSEYEKMVAATRNVAETERQTELKAKTAKLVATMAELNKTQKDLLALKREVKEVKRKARQGAAHKENAHVGRSRSKLSEVDTFNSEFDDHENMDPPTYADDEEVENKAPSVPGDDDHEDYAPIRAPKRRPAKSPGKLRDLSGKQHDHDNHSRRSRRSIHSKRSVNKDSDVASRKSNGKKSTSTAKSSSSSTKKKVLEETSTTKRGLRSMFGLKK